MRKFWGRKKVRSGLEARIKDNLDKRGITYGYESIKLKYVKKCCPHCKEAVDTGLYCPDFIIERASGIRLVVEAKGRFTGSDREKHKRVKRDNPGEDIRFVFQRDQLLGKSSKTKYSEWCVKNGFQYHIGEEVPQAWIDEK